ncbi:universal stress protein [Nocardia sp. NPDC051463]|uniref:universal stress protein n=1 Tax=Nocardia sp. NPDC051463 TaxID=3154845 RepID=UPI0034379D28
MAVQHENPHHLASAAVVVGTDGSGTADLAVRWAAATAAQRGRRLHIVHALDLAATRSLLGAYDVMVPTVGDRMRARGEQVLASAQRLASDIDLNLQITTELSEADPAKLLIALSESAHLVAIGATPGVGTLAHFGSTLLAVTSHGHGRIVVVRDTGNGQRTRTTGPVVVGVDGSPVGEAAIAAAFAEASERKAELVVIHAWSDLNEGQFAGHQYLEIPIVDLEIAEHALLAERLAGWQGKYPNVIVTRKVFATGPREHLAKWSTSAQLVVVGSRGRGGFQGLLLGSTSTWLVQHAHCPVMVAHPDRPAL